VVTLLKGLGWAEPIKAKSSDSNIEMAKLTLLKQVHSTLSATNYCLEMFDQQVANELRNVKDNALQLRLRRNIMNMLYDAQEAERASQYQLPTTICGATFISDKAFHICASAISGIQAQHNPQSELDQRPKSASTTLFCKDASH